MSGGFQNYFSGQAVKPAQVQYLPLTFSANTTLVWPTESIEGANYVAAWIDGSATAGALSIIMPDATQGSTGVATIISNVGANTFTVTSNTGVLIATIPAGQAWVIILKDNSTQAGTWEAVQLGATTSNAQAAALAGLGLQAVLTQLVVAFGKYYLNANQTITSGYRASGVVWQGATGALQLDASATLTAGWWCLVSNEGTGQLTISTTGGDTINGAATMVLPPNVGGVPYSALIICSAGEFDSFAGTPPIIPIAGGGTGASSAGQALINLGGSTIGIEIFEAANASSILAILGIGPSAFTEATIATNQNLTSSSANMAFVCTAALTLNLPSSASVGNQFLFAVYARGGAVTLAPNGTNSVNAGAGGASFTIPQNTSALVVNDGAGNWWLLFLNSPGIPWTTAAGTSDAITAAFNPVNPALLDGLLVGVRADSANLTTTPTLKVDGFPAYAITKRGGTALAPGDIAGAKFEMLLRYNLANTCWELLNPASSQPPWAIAAGTSDAITADYIPPNPVLYDGLLLGFRATAANTSPTPTFSPDGLAPHVIVKRGGSALVPGDIGGALAECLVRYNLANTRWELINSIAPVPTYHSVVFATTSTWTVPTGFSPSTRVRVRGCSAGAGASGGSGGASGNGGSGGGAGCSVDAAIYGFTAGQTVLVTIGTAGTGGVNSASGSNGGSTKFTYNAVDVITLSGGIGGATGSPGTGGNPGAATIAVGGSGLTIESSTSMSGQAGTPGVYLGNNLGYGGFGGSLPSWGVGGASSLAGGSGTASPSATGFNGQGYGSGGGGGSITSNTGTTGGNGANGYMIIEWWI